MFPDAARLSRLLEYLSIIPLGDLNSLDDIQPGDPESENKLTEELLDKIDHIRRALYGGNNYSQLGLFQFRIGLLFMEYGWFSEAAESFRKARNQWSYLPERPNICLANFATGVAYHRDRRFDLAKQIYSEVDQQIIRIREEVKVPSPIPQIIKYQEFVRDLTAQLDEAQKTVMRDIFHDLSPRIHPSLQTDSKLLTAPHLVQIDQDILQANIQHHLNFSELKSLCFGLKIDFHGLYGEGMANKARELVVRFNRNQRLPEIFQELSRRKPSISWEVARLRPNSNTYINGEVVQVEDGTEDVIEALFEEAESVVEAAGGGTEFFRTPLGKVRFHWEAEKTRAMNSRMVVVNIDLFGNFNEFSLQQQEQFIQFVSRITEIDPDQVTILEVIDGSIKATLEMPDESAKQLINFLLEDDPILKNFRILKVELGESVGPPENSQPINEATPGFLPEITPQVLCQFIFLYFTESQVQDLYFDLGIDYNSLPGDGKRDKAREIVAFCNRHNKFDQLVERSQTKRPKAFFEAFSTGN